MKLLHATRFATCALVFGLLGSCKTMGKIINLDFIDFPDSRVENLDRLHRPGGGHHYTVAFVGDFYYAANREGRTVGGLRIGSPSSEASGKPKQLESPSEACLELLNELLDFDSTGNTRLAAVQTAWCARIIQQDPSLLSRERAVLGLGPLGREVTIGVPVALPPEAPRATAEETATLLTDLVRTWRALLENTGTLNDFRGSCAVLRTTTFDLDGCRRVLPAAATLLNKVKPDHVGYDELLELVHDFQRRTIQLALARALAEEPGEASRVRAAVVTASVRAGGADMLARFMPLLEAERQAGADRDALVVSELLAQVAKLGLPESVEDLEPERYRRLRDSWIDLMVGFAVEDEEGFLRVKAMQALTRLETGPASLREEEWEDWYYARIAKKREEAGLPPTLDATDDIGPIGGGS